MRPFNVISKMCRSEPFLFCCQPRTKKSVRPPEARTHMCPSNAISQMVSARSTIFCVDHPALKGPMQVRGPCVRGGTFRTDFIVRWCSQSFPCGRFKLRSSSSGPWTDSLVGHHASEAGPLRGGPDLGAASRRVFSPTNGGTSDAWARWCHRLPRIHRRGSAAPLVRSWLDWRPSIRQWPQEKDHGG